MSHNILDDVRSIEDLAGAVLDLYMTLESESNLPISPRGFKGLDLAYITYSSLELFSAAISDRFASAASGINPVTMASYLQSIKSITVLDTEDDFL